MRNPGYLREFNFFDTEDKKKSFMLVKAKERAKKKGLEFSICHEDISIPEICPLLKIKLNLNSRRGAPDSPSLDRINNSKGYVKDNIWVISHRANLIKSDATAGELMQIALNLRKKVVQMNA